MSRTSSYIAVLFAAVSALLEPDVTKAQVVRTWISTESELIGHPTDLAIASDGALLVLDQINAAVLRLRAPGDVVLRVGRQGSGPGEFKDPAYVLALAAGFDVLDAGNNRLQRFDAAGSHVSTRELPPYAGVYPADLSSNGGIVVNTLTDSLLITVYRPTNEVLARFVERLAPMPSVIRVRAVQEEIRKGTVPSIFLNSLMPHFDPSGAVWVVHPTAGRVSLWSAEGRLVAEHELNEPEMPAIRRAFFDLYQDPDYRGLKGLSYVADLSAAPSGLWLLLDRGDELPAVLVRITRDGKRSGRWTLNNVRGARQVVVDEVRGRVFLGIPSEAAVVEVQLPRTERR